ncbi:nuclear transport factor 2 family protein [Haloactinomyces albus]|uniref:Ketosteroid isomerase-like protein n=1 Tax=Haloactinomyces albus TaxID=1352928 RepID=A0AAE3ZFK3_9ACTN|nr:nuclear transport factor 2 family protein [Haloactinomyces albus]MDR7303977.1 ketosteroid isomerase-like protein [Haloactinomyces albus]
MTPASTRTEIENTLNRYALGYDDGDLAMVKDTFTPEAVLSLRVAGGDLIGPFEGRDAILTMMRDAAHSQNDQRRHVTSNIIIDADDDRATSMSYLTIFSAQNGTLTALSTGKYEDELVRTEGGWKLSKRHIALDLPY